jgi:hypothetical protein
MIAMTTTATRTTTPPPMTMVIPFAGRTLAGYRQLRVPLDGLPVLEQYGLLLTGGYAFRAHEILHRPSQDLDFATRDDTPLPEIAAHVQHAFQRAGYSVRLVEATSLRYARLVLQLPDSGEESGSVRIPGWTDLGVGLWSLPFVR